jgi:hypothetical protein
VSDKSIYIRMNWKIGVLFAVMLYDATLPYS